MTILVAGRFRKHHQLDLGDKPVNFFFRETHRKKFSRKKISSKAHQINLDLTPNYFVVENGLKDSAKKTRFE